jgi:elongation factor Ts
MDLMSTDVKNTTVSAEMVRSLREKTGVGMMDCKAALAATQGQMDAAVDWLRAKGLAKAAKLSDRAANEGLVAVHLSASQGSVIEINSETDFVSRNEDFQKLARSIAQCAVSTDGTLDSLLKASFAPGKTVQEALTEATARIGENLVLRRSAVLKVPHGVIASYIHGSVGDGLGRMGVLVALSSSAGLSPESSKELTSIGQKIAMHIAASNPLALDPGVLDEALLEREKAVLAAKHVGKPEHVLSKILESGMKTYAQEVCLLEQAFIHDSSKTIRQVLEATSTQLGTPITLTHYVRFALGQEDANTKTES